MGCSTKNPSDPVASRPTKLPSDLYSLTIKCTECNKETKTKFLNKLDLMVAEITGKFLESNSLADGDNKEWIVELAKEEFRSLIVHAVSTRSDASSTTVYTTIFGTKKLMRSSIEKAVRSDELLYQSAASIKAFEHLDLIIKNYKMD